MRSFRSPKHDAELMVNVYVNRDAASGAYVPPLSTYPDS